MMVNVYSPLHFCFRFCLSKVSDVAELVFVDCCVWGWIINLSVVVVTRPFQYGFYDLIQFRNPTYPLYIVAGRITECSPAPASVNSIL